MGHGYGDDFENIFFQILSITFSTFLLALLNNFGNTNTICDSFWRVLKVCKDHVPYINSQHLHYFALFCLYYISLISILLLCILSAFMETMLFSCKVEHIILFKRTFCKLKKNNFCNKSTFLVLISL